MANEILVKQGTPIVWADTTSYNPALGVVLARTHQLNVTALADSKARQGAKADLGATRSKMYAVKTALEFAVAPAAGAAAYIYWSSSPTSTAALGNDGNATGADLAYKDGEEAEWVKQLDLIGVHVCTNDLGPQVKTVGYFMPPTRWGMPIVWNEAAQAFATNVVEMYVAVIPMTDEVQ